MKSFVVDKVSNGFIVESHEDDKLVATAVFSDVAAMIAFIQSAFPADGAADVQGAQTASQ
jgi:hypothetical protein